MELLVRIPDLDCLQGGVMQFDIPVEHKLGNPEPIFRKIEDEEINLLRNKFTGVQNEMPSEFELDLRVAQVLTVENNSESDKLYTMTVDVGEETPRTIVAGIKDYYQAPELIKKKLLSYVI